MKQEKLTGTIEYFGDKLNFDGATDLPLQAVKLYIRKNPTARKEISRTFSKRD